jgi:hypothetical protein
LTGNDPILGRHTAPRFRVVLPFGSISAIIANCLGGSRAEDRGSAARGPSSSPRPGRHREASKVAAGRLRNLQIVGLGNSEGFYERSSRPIPRGFYRFFSPPPLVFGAGHRPARHGSGPSSKRRVHGRPLPVRIVPTAHPQNLEKGSRGEPEGLLRVFQVLDRIAFRLDLDRSCLGSSGRIGRSPGCTPGIRRPLPFSRTSRRPAVRTWERASRADPSGFHRFCRRIPGSFPDRSARRGAVARRKPGLLVSARNGPMTYPRNLEKAARD